MKIAILSDIHANIIALRAVISDVERNKCQHLFVLGDLVGYYYWPKEVVEFFMENENCTIIRGNHEDILLRVQRDKHYSEKCYQKYGSGFNLCITNLSSIQLSWLSELPESKVINIDGLKIALFHGSDKHTNEYLYPDLSIQRVNEMASEYDFIFTGHTHYPVVFSSGNTIIANPGSVGQPRDIGSLASYAILNSENKALTFHRVPFDSRSICQVTKKNDPHYPYLYEIMKRNNPYA